MASKALPSPEVLRQLLRYEPETGKLFWLPRLPAKSSWNSRCAGKEAFTAQDGHGYRCGKVFNRLYLAHRVIWAIQTGTWPAEYVDHRNGDHTDNRWRNLRAATRSQNMQNRRGSRVATSAYTGVSYVAHSGRWKARIRVAGRVKYLGTFDEETKAATAYDIAARRAFGEYARPNFPAARPHATKGDGG